MITTGVMGRAWRASVESDGTVVPWDGSGPLRWFVAADDRWYVPGDEPTLRQRRLGGTPVVETRIRVPGGDAIHVVHSVADGPGYTVIEVENDSPMPFAVAFDRDDLLTERPPADVPIQGIELPERSIVLPVGHHARLRIAIAHDGSGAGVVPADLPAADQVERGWVALVGQAGRFELPEGEAGSGRVDAVLAARCELALGSMPHAVEGPGDPGDPVGFVIGLDTMVRMGEAPDPWLPELSAAVEAFARDDGWDVELALDAAERVLRRAGEIRALRDLDRMRSRRADGSGRRQRSEAPTGAPPLPADAPSGTRSIAWLEARFARTGQLLPAGLPPAWLGANFEVHDLPIGRASNVSYAVRWHGDRPAVLWEISGEPVELTAPSVDPQWRSAEPRGEALWAAPPAPSFG